LSWWTGVPSASTEVACGGASHRVVWERGRFRPVAHADQDGERVLAALGGRSPTCVVLADRWRGHADDLRVLAFGRRRPDETVGLTRDELAAVQAKADAAAESSRSIATADPALRDRLHQLDRARAERLELLSLFALPGPFQDRLVLTVASLWASRWSDQAGAGVGGHPVGPSELAALTAAVVGRSEPALEAWSGGDAHVELIPPGARPTVGARPDGDLEARLGLDWLAQVWCRDLARVADRFVLEVVEVDDDRARVLAVSSPGTDPEPLDVHRGPNGWERI
jgi:hypothetical protein